MFTAKNKAEALALKKQRVDELAKLLQLHDRQIMSAEQRMAAQNLKDKLEFRLHDLVIRSKNEEADIKIDLYEQMLKALNTK